MRGELLENGELHRLIDEKKWTLILSKLDSLISGEFDIDQMDLAIWLFESIDKSYREKNAQKYYLEMWKIAFRAGKIKLAKNYAEFILDYLIEYKRVPAIKKFIIDTSYEGLFKKNNKFTSADAILGKKDSFSLENYVFFESHPEMLKDSQHSLKDYLLEEVDWNMNHWKLAYEYIIKFHYDKDLFVHMAHKAAAMKKENHKKNFLNYLSAKKVNLKSFVDKEKEEISSETRALHVDYDQLAMDVISGSLEPSIAEQRKILISIKGLTDEEVIQKGKDMIVAFGLLGMDKVVIELCERAIPLMADVKSRASVQFMMAQAMFNSGDFYKVIDLVDDTFEHEPLLETEMNDFNYLKAESYLKLKKYKNAKDIYLKIKKYNPQYRLVGERLKHLEEIK